MLCLTACLYACGDDTADYPSFVTDLVEVHTDASKTVVAISLDNGKRYAVSSEQKMKAEVADTIYRCYASYVIDNGFVRLYELRHIISSYPVPYASFKQHPHEPVKIISMWKSGGYVNLHLGVLVSGVKSHSYDFCCDSIIDGTEYVSLLHLRPEGDGEAYTQHVYMSLPLQRKGDAPANTVLSINTYDGVKTFNY